MATIPTSLSYNGYTVDNTWKKSLQTIKGSLQAVYFNPKDPTQNFTTGRNGSAALDEVLSYAPGANNPGLRPDAQNFEGTFDMKYWNDAQKAADNAIANQIKSGALTVAQGEAKANAYQAPALPTLPNAPDGSAPKNPAQIQSEVINGQRYDVTSQAYRDALAASGGQGSAGMVQTPSLPQSPAPGPSTAPVSSYTGPSIVDYLHSIGQPSDFASRAVLAEQAGITGYKGTADQNTALLSKLRSQNGTPPTPSPAPPTPTPPPDPNAIDSSPITSYLKQLGIDPNTSYNQQEPLKSFQSIYEDVYKAAGLGDVKKQIDSMNKDISALDNKRIDEIATINDNPWLSEGVRQARVQKINDKYDQKKGVLVNQLQLQESIYDSGRSDARFVAQESLSQYNADRNFNENVLQDRINLAEKALEAQQKAQPSLKDYPVSYQEYLLAKDQGYAGTYNDYQTMDANRRKAVSNTTVNVQTQNAETADNVNRLLDMAVNGSGYPDGNKYAQIRATSKLTPEQFDARFLYRLSPTDQKKFGVAAVQNASTAKDKLGGSDALKGYVD